MCGVLEKWGWGENGRAERMEEEQRQFDENVFIEFDLG